MAVKHSSPRRVFADNVRRVRHLRKLSQEELAESAGLHRTYVSSVERAERNVSIDNMDRIAKALGVDLSELVSR